MIVLDASAMVEARVRRAPHEELLNALRRDVDAPHLSDVEVLSVLRGLLPEGKLDTATADHARLDHFGFTITPHETAPLPDRIWKLRHQITSHDASYVALAEALEARLYTCDAKLAGGHYAQIDMPVPRSISAAMAGLGQTGFSI